MTVKLLIRLLPGLLVLGFGAAALLGGSTQGLWNRERWLWADGGTAVRQRLGAALVAAYFAVEWLWGTGELAAQKLLALPEIPELWDTVGATLIGCLVLAKVLFASRYSGRQLLVSVGLCLWFAFSHMVTGYDPIANSLCAMLLLKDVDLRWSLRWLSSSIFAKLAVHLALIGAGVFTAGWAERWETGRLRADLQFGSVNFLGIALAQMAILWLALRPRFKLWHLLPFGAVLVFIQQVPDCRSAVIIGLGFAVLLVLARCLPQLFAAKPVQALLCLAAPLVAAFTWALSLVYDKDNKLMAAIDFVLSRRISLAYNTFGMEKLYGNQHFFFGQAFISDGFYRVDNSYIYYYYLCGPIMVALICLGFVLLTYRLLKQGDLPLALAVAMFTVYAVMEHCLSPGLNMTLYLMPIALYPNAEFVLTLQHKGPPKEERSLS